jgi:hypothetical protein
MLLIPLSSLDHLDFEAIMVWEMNHKHALHPYEHDEEPEYGVFNLPS